MKIEHKTLFVPLEVKAEAEEGQKTFSGYGAYFDNVDHIGDRIMPGAFAKAIADHKSAGTMPLMLLNHASASIPIGIWTALEEDEKGLRVDGRLIDTSAGLDTYTALKAGAITGLSIGYSVVSSEIDGAYRNLVELKLFEVSVVTFPCNDLARVTNVKSQEKKMTDEELKTALKDAGFEDERVSKLFAERDSEDEETSEDEKTDEEANDVSEDNDEAKYDEAAMMRAIKSIVQTTKEMHVR